MNSIKQLTALKNHQNILYCLTCKNLENFNTRSITRDQKTHTPIEFELSAIKYIKLLIKSYFFYIFLWILCRHLTITGECYCLKKFQLPNGGWKTEDQTDSVKNPPVQSIFIQLPLLFGDT